jgi:transposase-like protein
MKTAERTEARRLRREDGQSIKQIAAALGVSRGSVSVWVRDIELAPDQLDALRLRNPALNGQRVGARVRSEQARAKRIHAQLEGRRTARLGDSFHAAGCMLHWAEGSKDRNCVQVSNSDPALVVFFLSFLRCYFAVSDERVRIQCNLHADDLADVRRTEDFWIRTLGLPHACLTKSVVNRVSRGSKGKRTNMLPHGTCRLTVHDTAIVQHIYGAIQEYTGVEREEWLDCLPRPA